MNINIVVLFNECTVCCFFLLAILVLIIKINYKMNDFWSGYRLVSLAKQHNRQRERDRVSEREIARKKIEKYKELLS